MRDPFLEPGFLLKLEVIQREEEGFDVSSVREILERKIPHPMQMKLKQYISRWTAYRNEQISGLTSRQIWQGFGRSDPTESEK
jgi:hypothetical protein